MPSPPPVDPRILHGFDLSTPQKRSVAALAREIMNRIAIWRECPRHGCRRARACADPHARCFFIHHATMRDELLPLLREAAARRGE